MRDLINLNSLTDIISNCIGVLVLFSTLTLIQVGQKVYKVEVPLEYATRKWPVFFVCREDAVLHLDPAELAAPWARLASADKPSGEYQDLDYLSVRGALDLEGGRGIVLAPGDTDGWPTMEDVSDKGSAIRNVLDGIDPEKEYAYFFVFDESDREGATGSGFRSFRKVRAYLQGRGVETGWRPVGDKYPPQLCFWASYRGCRYDPVEEGGEKGGERGGEKGGERGGEKGGEKGGEQGVEGGGDGGRSEE